MLKNNYEKPRYCLRKKYSTHCSLWCNRSPVILVISVLFTILWMVQTTPMDWFNKKTPSIQDRNSHNTDHLVSQWNTEPSILWDTFVFLLDVTRLPYCLDRNELTQPTWTTGRPLPTALECRRPQWPNPGEMTLITKPAFRAKVTCIFCHSWWSINIVVALIMVHMCRWIILLWILPTRWSLPWTKSRTMEENDTLDDEILLQHGGAEIDKLTDIVGMVPDEDDENDINVINHSIRITVLTNCRRF